MNNEKIPYIVSRKWKLTLIIVVLAAIGTFIPPLISVWLLGAEKPLIILSGTEFTSLITLVTSVYFSANVWQKHIEQQYIDPTDSGLGNIADEKAEEDDSNKEA